MFYMKKTLHSPCKGCGVFFVVSDKQSVQIPQAVQILCRNSLKSTEKLGQITL